tara:strand:- start:531 stop:776 length:246 start_codon:yes stop_codon:yes gene_type:complete
MLKCADNEDIITMKADDAGDVVTFMFESPGEFISIQNARIPTTTYSPTQIETHLIKFKPREELFLGKLKFEEFHFFFFCLH